MGLRNMVIKTGATLGVTGGTDMTFVDDGVTVPNGLHIAVPATADYRIRENATYRYTPPTLQKDGTYLRDSKSVSYTVPMILASGKVVNNTVRIERVAHPEMSAANQKKLLEDALQLAFDSDTANFWSAGSLS